MLAECMLVAQEPLRWRGDPSWPSFSVESKVLMDAKKVLNHRFKRTEMLLSGLHIVQKNDK